MDEFRERMTIYFGASLFNPREQHFNNELCSHLEKKEYDVILPQRDGFEFRKLHDVLSKYPMSKQELHDMRSSLIYILDIGYFLPKSDFVVANLDEDIDVGLVVESCYARFLGTPIIGFRTDIRTPYGDLTMPLRGMHTFPVVQCDEIIKCGDMSNSSEVIQSLANALDDRFKNYFEYNTRNKGFEIPDAYSGLIRLGTELFEGEDLHSRDGLRSIIAKYWDNLREINRYMPKLIQL